MKIDRILAAAALVAGLAGCGARTGDEHGEGEHGKGEEAHGKAHDKHGKGEGASASGDPRPGEGHAGEEEGHDDRPERIKLSPEAQGAAQLTLVEAARRQLRATLTAPARLGFPQGGVVKLGARVAGRVARLDAKVGDAVKKGQPLASIESAELDQACADYLAARSRARVARGTFEREKELVGKGISAERELREAESAHASAQAELDACDGRLHALGLGEGEVQALKEGAHGARLPVRSPLDGTVVEVGAVLGESVEPTTTLFTIGELGKLVALVDVAESELARVRAGQPVTLEVPAAPGRVFAASLEHVGDVVDEKSRTVRLRVAVPNDDRALKPGMFGTARIETGEAAEGGPAAVIVPREAVQRVGGEELVFVAEADGEFRPVEVKVGATSATEAEILEGLTGGEQVVAAGAFILKSELSKGSMGEGHSH